MLKTNCVVCGAKLRLGEFGKNHDTCYNCFKARVLDILTKLHGQDRETIVWMMGVVADLSGYEW